MARGNRGRGAVATDEAATEEVEATSTTEAQPEATAEKPAEDAIDLTAFQAAVDEALQNADSATGTIAEQYVVAVRTAFRALSGVKAKNAAKAVFVDGMRVSMGSSNMPQARSYFQLQEEAAVPGGSKPASERTPVDPTEAFVERVSTLTLALGYVRDNVPEGVSEEWDTRVTETFSNLRGELDTLAGAGEGEEPEVSPLAQAAYKLAIGRAKYTKKNGGTRSPGGPRRNVIEHIRQALESKESGEFMSIGEIHKFRSTEYGQDDSPSAGAISARTHPKSGKVSDDLTAIARPTSQDGKKGVVKV